MIKPEGVLGTPELCSWYQREGGPEAWPPPWDRTACAGTAHGQQARLVEDQELIKVSFQPAEKKPVLVFHARELGEFECMRGSLLVFMVWVGPDVGKQGVALRPC